MQTIKIIMRSLWSCTLVTQLTLVQLPAATKAKLMRQELVKKKRCLFKCQHLENIENFFQFSKTHLKISVQMEVLIRMERESRTKGSGSGPEDVQAVSYLAPIWILMVSILELAIQLISCVWVVAVRQGLEGCSLDSQRN